MATDIEAPDAASVTAVYRAQRRQFQAVVSEVISAKVVFDENSIAAAKASQSDYAIPGAALGDHVLVTSNIDPAKIVFHGGVASAGVVTVTALNSDSTDASTDLAAAPTLNILVLKLNPNIFAN